jgi:hypothetical protein
MNNTSIFSTIPVQQVVDEFLTKKEYQNTTTLCGIMSSYGSDKGGERHNYTTFYSKLFSPFKNEKIHLFEMGIGSNDLNIPSNMGLEGQPGASLYGWSLFFPQGSIYGADIDPKALFQDKSIKTFACDQRDRRSVEKLFSQTDLSDIQFDIIIDDGLHEFDANLNLLLNSIHKLKKGGIYIVEDLIAATRVAFIRILPEIKKNLELNYGEVFIIPYKLNHLDNALLVIQK